jgi:hypothetical protein
MALSFLIIVETAAGKSKSKWYLTFGIIWDSSL